jgi:hypothetical protein
MAPFLPQFDFPLSRFHARLEFAAVVCAALLEAAALCAIEKTR